MAHGRANLHALLVSPRPLPQRVARAQARAAGWGRIADVQPVRNAEEAGRLANYLAGQLAVAWAWPKGGRQLRPVVYSRGWAAA